MAAISTTPPSTNHHPAMNAVLNTYELAEMLLLAMPIDSAMCAAAAFPALRSIRETSCALRKHFSQEFREESAQLHEFYRYGDTFNVKQKVLAVQDEFVEFIAVVTMAPGGKWIVTVTNSKELGTSVLGQSGTFGGLCTDKLRDFRSQLETLRSRRALADARDSGGSGSLVAAAATA